MIIRAARAVVGDVIRRCAVEVRDGVIAAIHDDAGPSEAVSEAGDIVDLAPDEVLLPGLVDTHVHVNEPGRTEWEGFATATRAAAAGGVTTLLDMPLNSIPPTIDRHALEVKRDAARGKCWVDVGFWGGAVPSSLGGLRALHDAGVFGVKAFLVDSGVDEFAPLSREQLREAMKEIADFDGLLLVHAENPALTMPVTGPDYADFVGSRPAESEQSAIELLISAAGETGARVHVVHLSAARALPALAAARAAGVRISVETCPHYLAFAAEAVPDGATQFKCCPPIRDAANRDDLWTGLAAGVIDAVVSDHSPAPAALKRLDDGDFGAAWGGIASLQLGLPVMWTHARNRGFGLADIVRWMASGPAHLAGLTRKGRIEVGSAADLLAFAPDATFTVDAATLHHRHAVSPYDGAQLHGVVRRTWLAGRPAQESPGGRLLARGAGG